MAMLPCSAFISPARPSALTAKTVEEKLMAKPTVSAARRSRSANWGSPRTASQKSSTPATTVTVVEWIAVTAQTCGLMRWRRFSFSPTVNSSRVIPRSASLFRTSLPVPPKELSTKPVTRNPMRGGSPIWLARNPKTKASEIQTTSPRAIATHSNSMSAYRSILLAVGASSGPSHNQGPIQRKTTTLSSDPMGRRLL
jgi:hypothetical protein